MAERRKRHAREVQLGFEAISIEGGLLSPEWLSRIAQLNAGAQSEADYRIPKGLNLRDEIGRYWRIAQANWNEFATGRAANADGDAIATRFIESLLRDALGYSSMTKAAPVVIAERSYPIGLSALTGRVPIVVAAAGSGLDALTTVFGDGGRRRSAFGLAQEYLNAQDGALWGIASDGLTLRIVRDNASLTRPAWIEVDLQRVFAEDRYSDFAALWLLMHETRFGRADQPVTECALEAWRNAGREEGTRAREHLRRGVEDALLTLGQGFLSHTDNQSLRTDLRSGSLSTKEYFNQILRLVYRIIFLLTVEERGLLHPTDAAESVKTLYQSGYSLRRLRDRSVKRSAHDRFSDLWESTKIVLKGVASGEPRLGLPALAGIFAANQCPALDTANLENRALLFAVFKLAWLREDGSLARVNWRDMGPEELGSVYESLLELLPQITNEGRQFAFASGAEAKGNARKTTGSYYTPDTLVQMLLDSALEPVIAETVSKNPGKPMEALLGLSIVDPACGSGHFLLAAARRLASHVARVLANGTPSAADYRHALRQVVGRCIYGVDLNPMAVELCRVSLWMEAVEPGLPLTFLDSHIQVGNALIGTTPDLMAKGIPDAAWEAIEGDDKKIAGSLRKKNKAEAGGQRAFDLSNRSAEDESRVVTLAISELEASSDTDISALTKKEAKWDEIRESVAYRHQKFIADAWCAAFFWPKKPEVLEAAPTTEVWRQLCDGYEQRVTTQLVHELTDRYSFFHWPLQFPQVFRKGGFDLVLGNPPWETINPDVKEFFSQFDSDVRSMSPSEQEARINLLLSDTRLKETWEAHAYYLYSSSHFIRNSGRYVLFAGGRIGGGDLNAYRMFVECAIRDLARADGGYVAQLVPEGIYNGANTSGIRRYIFEQTKLKLLVGFQNLERNWFPDVYYRMRFALYVIKRDRPGDSFGAAFGIVREDELGGVKSGKRLLKIPVTMIHEFSPDALAIMELDSEFDIQIAAKMYASHPKFGDKPSDVARETMREYLIEVHMGNDRRLFSDSDADLPVYEGRMLAAYDHRAKGYRSGRGRKADWQELDFSDQSKSIQPQWHFRWGDLTEKAKQRCRKYRIGFCDVASPTNERTLVATIIPPQTVCGHKVPTITFQEGLDWAYSVWIAVANSFSMDFIARKKASLSMTYTILDSLPFPRPKLNDWKTKIVVPRVARLVCHGIEMIDYWNCLAGDGFVLPCHDQSLSPGELDTEKRTMLKAELDAFVAREYFGLTSDQLAYILDTFPIVAKRDRKLYGEYRTKRVILESYEALDNVARNDFSHQSNLSPLHPDERSVRLSPVGGAGHFVVPTMIPRLQPAGEATLFIWAVLRASGGEIARMDLARAFSLRCTPDLLRKLAPNDISEDVQKWVAKVGIRKVSSGTLASVLRTLIDRNGVEQVIDSERRVVIKVSSSTAPEDQIDPWFRFEARLALYVLKSMPNTAVQNVDESVSGDDRALLQEAS